MSWIITWAAALVGGVTIGIIMKPYTGAEFMLAGALGFSWGGLCTIIRHAIVNPWPD